jgi:hypothetical protein
VITEAKDTIALLRKLAVVTAGLQVKMLAAEGRLQGPSSLLQKDAQKEELLSKLKNIGLNEEHIHPDWHSQRMLREGHAPRRH